MRVEFFANFRRNTYLCMLHNVKFFFYLMRRIQSNLPDKISPFGKIMRAYVGV